MVLASRTVVAISLLLSLPAAAQAPSAPVPGGTANAQPSHATQSVQEALKTTVSNAQLKMGDLDPWQKKIFVEEAVPQYQRFIRDYRVQGSNVQAEVDLDILKKYLAFHMNPKDNKKQETRLAVYVKGDGDCEKCSGSTSKLRSLVLSRVERRGFTPVFISPDDLNTATGKTFDEKVLSVAIRKGWIGAMVLQTSIAPKDDQDAAHADENEYVVRTSIGIPSIGVKQENQLRVLESESLEVAAARLMTDTFTDLGARTLAATLQKVGEESGEEIALNVTGIRDYHQYSQLRMVLVSKIQEVGSLDERKIARGKATFAIKTQKTAADVKAKLVSLMVDQAHFTVMDAGSTDKSIEAEIR